MFNVSSDLLPVLVFIRRSSFSVVVFLKLLLVFRQPVILWYRVRYFNVARGQFKHNMTRVNNILLLD